MCWPYIAGTPSNPSASPTWFKFTLSHTQLQAAALTNSITLYALPAGCIIHGAKLKHSVTFDGPAITEYHLSLGFAGETQALLIEYDVESIAVGSNNFAISQTFDSRDHNDVVNVLVTGRSVGANLNTSTQGTAEVWLLVSKAK